MAGSAVDLMEAKSFEAERLSRGEARLRRRAERRALDSLLASEKDASMRPTARCVGGGPTRALAERARIKCI